MSQELPFNVESIGEMADFLAGQLQEKVKGKTTEEVLQLLVPEGRETLAKMIEDAIYNFEADLIGRYGSDQAFIDLGEEIDETEDTEMEDPEHDREYMNEDPDFLEEGDEWRR